MAKITNVSVYDDGPAEVEKQGRPPLLARVFVPKQLNVNL
jgi:hypothetical protein